MELPNIKGLWGLNTHTDSLTVVERKDAYLLIVYLNTYNDFKIALDHIRKDWLGYIYPLPKTHNIKQYNVAKSCRCTTIKRLKRIYKDYIVRIA
tara:strand:+ start:3546 stop:3827 length:282 start_codon:yes stop_codon:yes gene_type:complete